MKLTYTLSKTAFILMYFLLLPNATEAASEVDGKYGYILSFHFSDVPYFDADGEQLGVLDTSKISKDKFPLMVKSIPASSSLVQVMIDGQSLYFNRFDIKTRDLPEIGSNIDDCEVLTTAAKSSGADTAGFRAGADSCEQRN